MRSVQAAGALLLVFSFALVARAVEPATNDARATLVNDGAARPRASLPARASTVEMPARRIAQQPRVAQPNYAALTAGAVLFGFSYALAVSDPIRHGFDGSHGRRAIPLVGPWFANVSWPWALDGVAQMGGVAFAVSAFVLPARVLGTPSAFAQAPAPGEHWFRIQMAL